jgi:hypothetical protein
MIDHGMRRRDMTRYSEFEFEAKFHDGSVVGVVYILPHGDSSVLFTTCFGAMFQPLRRILFGPGDDHERRGFAQEMERARPLFMAAISNGLYNELENGALIQYNDPNDDTGKTLLVCEEERRVAGASLLDESGLNTLGAVFGDSCLIFEEAFAPLDSQRIARHVEFAELRDTAGSAAKWLFEHSHEIRDVVRILSG